MSRDDADLIDDLKHKIPYRLGQAAAGRSFGDIHEFADFLVGVENDLDVLAANNPRNTPANNTTTSRPAPARGFDRDNRQTTSTAVSGPAANVAVSPAPVFRSNRRPELTVEQRKLASEGRCFNCKITGHFSRDCPNPRTPGGRIQMVEVNPKEINEVKGSGNDST